MNGWLAWSLPADRLVIAMDISEQMIHRMSQSDDWEDEDLLTIDEAVVRLVEAIKAISSENSEQGALGKPRTQANTVRAASLEQRLAVLLELKSRA
jgi:hypothetical protein